MNRLLLIGLMLMPACVFAENVSEYESGKKFGELTVSYFMHIGKKDFQAALEIEKERAEVQTVMQSDWVQGMHDALAEADMKFLMVSEDLSDQEIAHAYVLYFTVLCSLESALKVFKGEAPAEIGDEIYARAAQAAYGDSSEEVVEDLKESFYYFAEELQNRQRDEESAEA